MPSTHKVEVVTDPNAESTTMNEEVNSQLALAIDQYLYHKDVLVDAKTTLLASIHRVNAVEHQVAHNEESIKTLLSCLAPADRVLRRGHIFELNGCSLRHTVPENTVII